MEDRRAYRCTGWRAAWSGSNRRWDAGRASGLMRQANRFRTGQPHEYPDEQGRFSGRAPMPLSSLAVQGSARRTRIGEVLERGPRAADTRHSETPADSLYARISELTRRQRPPASGRSGGTAATLRFLHGWKIGHPRGQWHGVPVRGDPAQYFENQKLRGLRHGLD